jgi:hypothetical protein
MRKRVTDVDFSRHEVEIIKNEYVLIHKFKRPDSNVFALTFINTCGVMTVTGDLGNWVFCREFHPSGDNESSVSRGYWDEKLQISSAQKADVFDTEETKKQIAEFKNTFEESFDREMNEEEKDWVERLESCTDDEHEYIYVAYRETPSDLDYEYIPFGEKRHWQLEAVYDGFNALCDKLEEMEAK